MALQTTTCCGCHAQVPTTDTFFSALGEVCHTCHSSQAASDSARFSAGANGHAALASLTQSSGPISIYIGPVDIVPLVRGLFGFIGRIARSVLGRHG